MEFDTVTFAFIAGIGVIAITAIILFIRHRRGRWERIGTRKSYDGPTTDVDDDVYGSELPSGGARTVAYRDPVDLHEIQMKIREQAEQSKPKLSSEALGVPQQQSLLSDEPEVDSLTSAVDDERIVPMLVDTDEEHSEPTEQGTRSATSAISEETDTIATQTSLLSDEDDTEATIDVVADKANTTKKTQANTTEKKTNKSSSDTTPEIIVINLMAKAEHTFAGQSLLDALVSSGMRFGDMDIFHYLDKESGSTQFSMANLLNPGTFSLREMDNFKTPGVCFFLELFEDRPNLPIYETMLKVVDQLCTALDGDVYDEERSVLTAGSVEHQRQRIREFERKLLTKGKR